MDIEKEINYRVQLSGRRLGTETPAERAWFARDIEMQEARRKATPEREIPTFKLPRF